MVYKFFDSKVTPLDKKTMSSKGMGNNKILAEELHKPVIKNLIKEIYIRNLRIIYGE